MSDVFWFDVIDLTLHVQPSGSRGAHALACAMGLSTLPVLCRATFERGEWRDLLAKARGMRFAGCLYRAPIVRQWCGCRVCAEPVCADESTMAHLVVRTCPSHALAGDTELHLGTFYAQRDSA